MTAKDNEGNKGKVTDTTKVTIYCQIYKRVRKVRGGCIWSSARSVMSIARMVESWMCAWTIVAGSCGRSSRWMQLDDRCGKLRSVESLVNRCPGFWQYVGLTGGVSIWLLARTASRRWARCCNARAVRNSESLRGLDAALLGQSVTASRYVDWMLHCWGSP